MNLDVPPKLDEAPHKSSQPSFLLGVLIGVMAGIVLATLLWVAVGSLFLSKSRRVQSMPSETMSLAGDRSTLAEIDAASRLSFEQNRLPLYNQIATRTNLSAEAQVYLVQAIFQHVTFENERLTPLLKLIANPAFSPAAKEAVLNHLSNLSFENNRQKILEAMGKREQ